MLCEKKYFHAIKMEKFDIYLVISEMVDFFLVNPRVQDM